MSRKPLLIVDGFIKLNIAHSQQMMEWNENLLILCDKLDYRRCQTSFSCYHSYSRLSSYPFVALLVPPALLLRTIKGCGPPLNGIHLLVFNVCVHPPTD